MDTKQAILFGGLVFFAFVLSFHPGGIAAGAPSSETLTISLPVSVKNSNGIEFKRETLVESLRTEGCSTSCSGNTMYCTCHSPPCNDVTYACGCCGSAAGCMNGKKGEIQLTNENIELNLELDQDVLELEVELISVD